MAFKVRSDVPVAQVLPHSGLERELLKVAHEALPDTTTLKVQLAKLAALVAKDVAHDVSRGRIAMAMASYEVQLRVTSVLNCLV